MVRLAAMFSRITGENNTVFFLISRRMPTPTLPACARRDRRRGRRVLMVKAREREEEKEEEQKQEQEQQHMQICVVAKE